MGLCRLYLPIDNKGNSLLTPSSQYVTLCQHPWLRNIRSSCSLWTARYSKTKPLLKSATHSFPFLRSALFTPSLHCRSRRASSSNGDLWIRRILGLPVGHSCGGAFGRQACRNFEAPETGNCESGAARGFTALRRVSTIP